METLAQSNIEIEASEHSQRNRFVRFVSKSAIIDAVLDRVRDFTVLLLRMVKFLEKVLGLSFFIKEEEDTTPTSILPSLHGRREGLRHKSMKEINTNIPSGISHVSPLGTGETIVCKGIDYSSTDLGESRVASAPDTIQPTSPEHISIGKIASELRDVLSPTLTAYVAGAKDLETVDAWAVSELPNINVQSEQQLRDTYKIIHIIEEVYPPEVARDWLVGSNSRLGSTTPAQALSEGRSREVLSAALSFVAE